MKRTNLFFSMAGSLFLAASGAAGQVVTLDQGVFRISMDGRSIGTETFSIRQTGTGPEGQVLATAQLELQEPGGPLYVRVALDATVGEYAIRRYEVKTSGTSEEEIDMRPSGQRLVATTRSSGGEREREFRATATTVVIESGVSHQLFFLVSRVPTGGSVSAISPRTGRQFDVRITEVGVESLMIGGQQLSARHLRAEAGGEVRELWVDREGRVLRVQGPQTGYVAVREQSP